MGKEIQLSFGNFYKEKFSKPIRTKQDCVSVILNVLNVLLIGEEPEDEKGKIVVKIDKMSRLFCFLKDKYFSIVFPFAIEKVRGADKEYIIYDATWNQQINTRTVALMESMLQEIDFESCTIDEIIEKAYFDVAEEEYVENEISNSFRLVLQLLSTEYGYIRYDYDEEHEKGDLHPLCHCDINYSAKATYKLGIKDQIEAGAFIDLLDSKTKCYYVR